MKRTLTMMGVSLVAMAVFAQDDRPFSQVMKEIGGATGQVKKAFESGAKEEVASGGEKLQSLFKEVEVFFTKRAAADAIESAKSAQAAAKELNSEAVSGTKHGAEAAFAKISGSCKGCHDAHREKLPEGGYKIK